METSNDAGEAKAKGRKKPSELEMMKERYAKLLLGEDMSGAGKGVSSALALSNAITNLAASIFGEQSRLEPMSAERKARWKREMGWLLSVTDHIVEFVPKRHRAMDGSEIEVMTTRRRVDILMNIPALRKLDNMLIESLDNFKGQNEFWYVKRDQDDSDKENDQQKQGQGEKWWLPIPKVPPEGLSEVTRKWIQFQKESVNQVHKAALAINAQVLMEMDIPHDYIESLPKNGRASLGDANYRSITDEHFNPVQFLSNLDLSTEHKILDLKNRVEASIVIWKRKMRDRKSSRVSIENRELFEERAETILVLIKQRFPGIPQSTLDISKIQYNKDVGHSALESYSRTLETLAHTVMSRIDDVLHADSQTQNPSSPETNQPLEANEASATEPLKFPNAEEEREKINAMDPPASMTLSDFKDKHVDQEEVKAAGKTLDSEDAKSKEEPPKTEEDGKSKEEPPKTEEDGKSKDEPPKSEVDGKLKEEPPKTEEDGKFSYVENLGEATSPNARH